MELTVEFARSPAAKLRKKDSVNDGEQSYCFHCQIWLEHSGICKHETNHNVDGESNRPTGGQALALEWDLEYPSSPPPASFAASSYSLLSAPECATYGEFTFYSVVNY